ncbi:Protein tyrosine kinase [Mycena sanguinolenta]|uniref:Protein tyrosine kinase n=1 Tax=Mycena sanguinolenta TaxID=230812 RepID=A0A8H7D590_9AGAR|nr:Protein tyrosine kinase [Mycena sanguinolenta]
MSATSGIGVSRDLSAEFSRCTAADRSYLHLNFQESLVHDLSLPIRGSLQEDFAQLDDIIQEDTPTYLLAKLDDPPTEWLVIYYSPDSARVRDKMLYASSRTALKSLGSSLFSDSMFATSKADLTPEARWPTFALRGRQAGGSVYQGSRARNTHMGNTVGMPWAADLEDAVKGLSEGDDSVLVVAVSSLFIYLRVIHRRGTRLSIWTPKPSFYTSTSPTAANDVGASLPVDGASYAFFAWKHAPSQRNIVLIYSCPSSCPVKHRMTYASGFNAAYIVAQTLLADSPSPLHSRKIETSTPAEIDEAYLRSELDFSSGHGTPGSGTATPANDEEKKPFARPRGPKRR